MRVYGIAVYRGVLDVSMKTNKLSDSEFGL